MMLKTSKRVEILDITNQVEKEVEKADSKDGIALVYSPHTTTAIVINEAERGLLEDLINSISNLIPEKSNYIHNRIDDNADAHIRASLLGNAVVVPFENKRLLLGTWQRILFIEFDGPRNRRVIVKIL